MRISTALINQRALNGILNQQARLSDLQLKIATGKRINVPSDDPVGAAQIVRLTETIKSNEQFIRNANMAKSRLNLEESVLASVENALQRVRELALQASNSHLSNLDRKAIAVEVRQRLDELLSLANSQDANQKFLFSGTQVNSKPVTQTSGGFVYNGDQGQRSIQISSNLQVTDGDSGSAVFFDNITGNGIFTVQDNPTNTGAGIIDPGTVFDRSALVRETYTISFVTNSNANLGFNVIGSSSGQLIPPLPADPVLNAPDFVAGNAMRFNGIETKIDALPVAGDSFSVQPSVKQDLFTTVDNLVSALETRTFIASEKAQVQNQINRSIMDLDRAFDNIIETRSSVGSRLGIIDEKISINESFILEITTTLSEVQDLDLISAASEMQLRVVTLEAAQASYMLIQGLSIFNFL